MLPEKIEAEGTFIPVKQVIGLKDDTGSFGQLRVVRSGTIIEIDAEISERKKWQILLHEINHLLLNTGRYTLSPDDEDAEERFVRPFTAMQFGILARNRISFDLPED